jgi:transcriptional regulator with XRE-family HTH domain
MDADSPISDVLRRAVRASGLSLKALEREAGVQRASLSRFMAGKQSLRLDIADKLAAYFELRLGPQKKGK